MIGLESANQPGLSLTSHLTCSINQSALLAKDRTDNQLIQELTYLYETTRLAYEHSRRLQAIIRPFLSSTTWHEATKIALHNGQPLYTKTRKASILRLDIADFTELMDSHPFDQVLAHLNAYLDRLTQIVYDHHGDIDKYLGDGFLAIFATADDAVYAGCALQHAATDFNHDQAAQGGLIFPTRIGIDSGPVAITSLGSHERQDRTVIGLAVNVAERLQAQATPGRVWLSQATFERLQNPLGCRCLEAIEVKGCAQPVVVYEML